ncbi:hypothetical protein Leryth_002317 [Lithospermum erythrorhizon]|nr:hypothetical protein Leryth_002317 [Lithospermum erythrorhizon]
MLELYVPYLKGRTLGKNVVFDMDMSAGDFVALFYLLNVPVEVINLKGILVSPTAKTAMETWREIVESLDPGKRISVLTNGPLTNLAKIILSETLLQFKLEIFIVGGHLSYDQSDKGNVINVPANKYAEMNMFLDPWAAKIVLESELNITLIPLGIQRKVSNFNRILEMLYKTNKTAEVLFTQHLLSRLRCLVFLKLSVSLLQDIFLGEILGAITLANIDHPVLKPDFELKRVKVHADGDESQDGQVTRDEMQGRLIRVLEKLDIVSYYDIFAERLGDEKQSAVVGSFNAQKRMWSKAIESFLFLHQ